MIRKRDFILYLLGLGFLIVGTSYTAFSGGGGILNSEEGELPFLGAANTPAAVIESENDTRAARIDELKAKLARGEGQITNAPPVLFSEASASSVDATIEDEIDEVVVNETRVAEYCGAAVPHRAASVWPNAVSVETTAEGRTAYYSNQITDEAGQNFDEKVELITLPVREIRSTFDTCLPDTNIGVATSGSLLHNEQASRYMGVSSNSLIGYARDGFPIYGPLPDPSVLDSCGGYYQGFSYEYHVRTDDAFVIGCYASAPADFN